MRSARSCTKWKSVLTLPWKDRSTSGICTFSKVESEEYIPGRTPVYLNVYDLTLADDCLYWAGMGAFHTGIEVHGTEYAFGAHEFPASGIFEVDPHECPGFKFRKSILIGTTNLDDEQVRDYMELQSMNYQGHTYHLIYKNCNHFSEDLCQKLTGNPIPKWVNRLAKIGSKCSTVLPKSLKGIKVCHNAATKNENSETRRLKTAFSCFSSMCTTQDKKDGTLSSLLINDCFPRWRIRRPHHYSCKDTSSWAPPNVTVPVLNLVDKIFQLKKRGWLRRQVFWMSKQILQLIMEDAVDDWLLRQVHWVRSEDVIAQGIRWVQDILWPGGTFFKKINVFATQVEDGESNKKTVQTPRLAGNKSLNTESFDQHLEAARRANEVKKLLFDGAPSALVSLIGPKQYKRCAEDLYYFSQSQFALSNLHTEDWSSLSSQSSRNCVIWFLIFTSRIAVK